MMPLVVFAVFVTVSPSAGQVEHAPTAAQCQADQRLWLSRLEGPSSQLPEYKVLVGWSSEMKDCQEVDPTNNFKYFNTRTELTAEQQIRLSRFLERHGLWNQFRAEDAAGKR
jgi:hypothetical protein